jgi:VanZ family protein
MVLIFAVPNIISLSGGEPTIPKRYDKLVHFVEYLILAFLVYRGFSQPPRRQGLLLFCAAAFAGLAVGALDEYTQHFLPRRDSSILDWLADAVGVIAGTSLASIWHRRANEKREAA